MKKNNVLPILAVGLVFLSGCETATVGGSEGPDLTNCRDAGGVNTTATYTCDEVAAIPELGIPENTQAACSDVFDNDLDGLVNEADPDCASILSPVEPSEPSAKSYPFGIMAASANVQASTDLYNAWITQYYEESPDASMGRIRWDKPSLTVSEGTGYGMLIAVFADDQYRFNQLTTYAFSNINPSGVLPWKINGFNGVSTEAGSIGGASDADLDVATALIIAHKKWGDDYYLAKALELITSIKSAYFDRFFDDEYLLCIGDADCRVYNPSYFSPVAFRLFASVDPANAAFWNNVVTNNYAVVVASQNHGFNLYPNWTDEYGAPDKNHFLSNDYNKWALESVRVPWRLAWDYLWYGEPTAKASLDAFNSHMFTTHGGDLNNTGQKYRLTNGQAQIAIASPAYAGAICLATMVEPLHQDFVNDCYGKVLALNGHTEQYFHSILKMMYFQLMSGQYVKPDGV